MEKRQSHRTESPRLKYAEIARELQVSKTVIGEDMLYLRKRAKESIKEYVTEHLPEQYQICLSALDTILKNTFVILQKSQDNREKLAAMELFKDTHLVKLELLSNATTIDSALHYIRSKQSQQAQQQGEQPQHQQKEKKHLTADSTNTNDAYNDNDRLAATTTTTTGQLALLLLVDKQYFKLKR